MTFRTMTAVLAISLGLSGCTMIPDLEMPKFDLASFLTGNSQVTAQDDLQPVQVGWQDFFADPQLAQVVGLALENNRDLKVAALRVEAFRAQYRIQRSQLMPALAGDASYTRQRTPGEFTISGQPSVSSQYSVGAGLSYELDFFGRVQSLSENVLEQYLAQEASQRAAQLALTADVAVAYLTLKSDQAQLAVTQDMLTAYQQSLTLMQSRMGAGTATELEVQQAKSAVDSARVQLAQLTRAVSQDINALQVLVGGNLPVEVQSLTLSGRELADLPAGLSSDVLLNRPDIVAAEHNLHAANANIGAARAAFFPSVTLTAGAGTTSTQLSGLFDGGSGYWSFMPQIRLPIFMGGQLSASLDYAEIQKDISIAQYEKAIQVAFREVADGLAARETFRDQLASQGDLVQTNSRYLELAQQRFQAGVDNYLTVLDAQRALLAARQQLISTHLAQMASEISLYKALGGGGWQ